MGGDHQGNPDCVFLITYNASEPMYSNQDERRRCDDDSAVQRRKDEEQRVYERLERQNKERLANERAQFQQDQRQKDDQRTAQEWDEWQKTQAERTKLGGVPLGWTRKISTTPDAPGSSATATSRSSDDGEWSFVFLGMLLALIAAPPFLAYLALGSLLRKFPRYVADPSFAGQVAKSFVQGRRLWSDELEAFHWRLSFKLQARRGWDVFFYTVQVWLCAGIVLLFLWCLFRVHKVLGLAASATLLVPI